MIKVKIYSILIAKNQVIQLPESYKLLTVRQTFKGLKVFALVDESNPLVDVEIEAYETEEPMQEIFFLQRMFIGIETIGVKTYCFFEVKK